MLSRPLTWRYLLCCVFAAAGGGECPVAFGAASHAHIALEQTGKKDLGKRQQSPH